MTQLALLEVGTEVIALTPGEWRRMHDHHLPRQGLRITCGRCGLTDWIGHVSCSHDLGWCGCPTELDPAWSKLPKGPGFQSVIDGGKVRSHLTDAEMDTRWDNAIFPPCEQCGHGFGNHSHGACYLYCGCEAYHLAQAVIL